MKSNTINAVLPLIYNGVEEVEQAAFPKLVTGKINILFAGRLEYQKGVDELISVTTALKDDRRFHFHIVGEGSEEHKLRSALNGNRNVTRHQKIYGLNRYLSSFDYLFMPSNFEGLPLMSIEASLNRVPSIANDCPGLRDVLPPDWPLKVKDNSVPAYLDIFRKQIFETDRRNLGDRAYAFAKAHFHIEVMQEKYERFYEQLFVGKHAIVQ